MRFAITMLGALLGAAALEAQAPPPQQGVCFRAHPIARCRAFVILEVAADARLAGSARTITFNGPDGPIREKENDLTGYLGWEVGAMVNRDSSHAVGAALQIGGASGNGARVALKGRRRWWSGNEMTVDLSAGPLVVGQSAPRGNPSNAYGLTAESAFGYGDLAALTLGADVTRGGTHTASALHAGVRLGSWGAVGGTALVAIGFGLLVAALGHGD